MKIHVHRESIRPVRKIIGLVLAFVTLFAVLVISPMVPNVYAAGTTNYRAYLNGIDYGIRTVYTDSTGRILPLSSGSTSGATGRMLEGLDSGDIAQSLQTAGRLDYTINPRVAGSRHSGHFVQAYWVKDDVVTSGSSRFTGNYFGDDRYPKIKIKALHWDGKSGSDSVTTVVPADEVATSQQNNVDLTFKTSEVGNHIVLQYLDDTAAKSVHFTLESNVTNVTADTYNSLTGNAYFGIEGNYDAVNFNNNKYSLNVRVTYKRGDDIRFYGVDSNNNSQTVTSTLLSDTSTQDETIQTYKLEINNLVTGIRIASLPIGEINTTFEARQESQSVDTYPLAQFNIPYVDQGTGTPRQWPIATSCRETVSIDGKTLPKVPGAQDIGYCWGADYFADGSFGTVHQRPLTYGFQNGDSRYGITGTSDRSIWNNNGVNTATSFSSVTTKTSPRSMAFTIDAIPPQLDQGRTNPSGQDFMQDWLSSLTLTNQNQGGDGQTNQQEVIVPTPDLCRKPDGKLGTKGSDQYNEAEYCYFSKYYALATGQNNWGVQKLRMSCIRSWILGYNRDKYSDSDIASGCGANAEPSWSTDLASGAIRYTQPNILMDQTIKSGAFAGTRVVVKLLNLRSLVDSGISIQDNTSSIDNGGAYPSDVNASRWRTRYQVELYNVPITNVKIQANWSWASQQRVLLGSSSGVTPVPGSISATDSTAVSVYGYGDKTYGDSTAKTLDWKTICVGGLGTADGGSGCNYVWQDQDGRSTMPVGFAVQNGYTNPVVQYTDSRVAYNPELHEYTTTSGYNNILVTPTNPITGAQDGNSYISLPKVASATPCAVYANTGSCLKQFSGRAYVPLYVNAQTVTVPLKYYSAETNGSDLQGVYATETSDPFKNLTFNVQSDAFKTVATSVPVSSKNNEVFSHWKLVGVKNGAVIGTIGKNCTTASGSTTCGMTYNNVSPGQTLDLSNPQFADGAQAGKAAVTNGTGALVVDEYRLVPVFVNVDSTATGDNSYFRAEKVLRSDSDTVVDSFTYVALAGLHASYADTYKNDTANTTYTPSGDNQPTYPRSDDASTYSINPLVSPSASILRMVYIADIKVNVGKTVDKALYDSLYAQRNNTPLTSDFSWAVGSGGGPSATDFRVRFTNTQDNTKVYNVVTHAPTSSTFNADQEVNLPAGTYQVTEPQIWNGTTWVDNTVWTVKRSAGSFECYAADDSAHATNLLNKATGILTVNSSGNISCTFTNAAAAVSLLTYNGATGQYIPNTTGGSDTSYRFNFEGTDTATSSNGWPAKGKVQSSMGWISSDAEYTLRAVAVPADMTLVGFQLYSPGADTAVSQYLSAETDTDASHWSATDTRNANASATFTGGNNLSTGTDEQGNPAVKVKIAANQFAVYRAVVVPTNQLTTLYFNAGLDNGINWAGAKRVGTDAQDLVVDKLAPKSTDNANSWNPSDQQKAAYLNNYALEVAATDGPASGKGAGVVTNGNNNLDANAGKTYKPTGTTTDQTVTANPTLSGTSADGSVGKFFILRGTGDATKKYALKELFKGATVSTADGLPNVSGYGVNTNLGLKSLTCTPVNDEDVQLDAQTVSLTSTSVSEADAALHVPSTWKSVTCSAVNGMAQLGFLIYNDTANKYIGVNDDGSNGVDTNYKFDIARSQNTTAIDAGTGWPGKGTNVGASTSQVSPMVAYSLNTNTNTSSIPLGWVVKSCQVWTDGTDNAGNTVYHDYNGTNPTSSAQWTDVPCDQVTVPAGRYLVVRAVVQQGVPVLLPSTGRPADYFIIGGIAAFCLAGALIPLIHRWKGMDKLPFRMSK